MSSRYVIVYIDPIVGQAGVENTNGAWCVAWVRTPTSIRTSTRSSHASWPVHARPSTRPPDARSISVSTLTCPRNVAPPTYAAFLRTEKTVWNRGGRARMLGRACTRRSFFERNCRCCITDERDFRLEKAARFEFKTHSHVYELAWLYETLRVFVRLRNIVFK